MEKNEILQEINRLKSEVDRLDREIRKPKDETIYVPKGMISDNTFGGIINKKKCLHFNNNDWGVISYPNLQRSTKNKFKLVPCKRDELEAGDLAFVYLPYKTLDFNQEIRNMVNYCVVIEDGIACWVSENGGVDLFNYELNSEHVWYKVAKA